MAYARQYDVSEVKGMLMIAEGSANITSFRVFEAAQKAKGKAASFSKAPAAHAGTLHASQTATALSKRADTGPAQTSTFKDFDTLVLATTEALNHANGQAALALLDGGAIDATFNAPLAANKYFGSRATRMGKKKSGNVVAEPYMVASEVFVKVVCFVAGKLWIQTSYPSKMNERALPSLAQLP